MNIVKETDGKMRFQRHRIMGEVTCGFVISGFDDQ